jgi:putative ABC transport system permease protein
VLDTASSGPTIVLHTEVEPGSVTTAAREAIRQIDPSLAIYRILTADELVDVSTAGRQFNTLLFSAFAALALLLATIGLYGLVSYAVSQRQAEIGIRIALGATRSEVHKLILLQGLKPATAGLVLGLVTAAFATRVLRSQLFGVTPVDPLTFVIVPLLLLSIAMLACFLLARRATRLDPIAALRAE